MDARRRRLLLITPPYHAGVVESAGRWPNLGFVYLAGHARAAGYEVRIFDAMSKMVDLERIAREIEAFAPDYVGSTAVTASTPAAMEVLRVAKEIDPRIVTLIGGIHATFMYEELLRAHPWLDYAITGEGEEALPELLRALDQGGGEAASQVRGVAFRAGERVVYTGFRPFIRDMDALIPAWDLLDWQDYTLFVLPGSTLGLIDSSRGCVHACSFCSQQKFWRRRYRQRSAESFVAELESLRDRFGVNVVMLSDEYPTLDRERWHRILDLLIARRVGVYLLLETCVGDIIRDAALIDRYRQAGVVHVYVGVEATSDERLSIFKKNIRCQESKQALDLLNGAGIVTECSFVLGMPDDTPASIERTLEIAFHYAPDMPHFLTIAPWPYADLYQELAPHVITRDYAWYNFVEPVVKPVAMEPEEVKAAILRCYREYYTRTVPRYGRIGDAFKREYMQRAVQVMMTNSFLKQHMRAQGEEMPAWVRRMLGETTVRVQQNA